MDLNCVSKCFRDNLCTIVLTVVLLAIYSLYYKKYRHYVFHQVDDVVEKKRPRGKCPPFFPNGWYRLLNTDELPINAVKYVNYCGRNLVLFRGTNKKVYALDAYCSHMGANLGLGGQVKNNCIQCPFHGWVFEGETGNCVVSADNLAPKKVTQFEYNNGTKESVEKNGEFLQKCYEGNVKLKKYHIQELHDSIMVWFDSRDEFQDKFPYEPLKLEHSLDFRGESINYVNCHIQEIPENGADMRHFDFLHDKVAKWCNFVTFEWKMKSHRASEPDLYEVMKHEFDFISEFKFKTLKKYLTEENKKYINVISLCAYLKIFGWKFFVFNATGFQVGPSLVYLFLKSKFFETIFAQSITPLDKFHIRVSHKIFTSNYLPYWISAVMLYGEVTQVMNDMSIWNNKIFGSKLTYNTKANADQNLISWRNWYYQFYEGCHEFDKKLDALDW
jgi:cholesterol 7-dehydrogenase